MTTCKWYDKTWEHTCTSYFLTPLSWQALNSEAIVLSTQKQSTWTILSALNG